MEEGKKENILESKKGIGKILIIVIIALIITGGIVGYMMMSPKSATAPSQTATPTSAEVTQETPIVTSEEQQSTEKIVVEGSPFKFVPNKITVKKGEPVTIVFKNVGGFHSFKVDEFEVATKQIQSGQSEEVTFTPDKVGDFEYYCSVGNHRAMGMKGTLTVTE